MINPNDFLVIDSNKASQEPGEYTYGELIQYLRDIPGFCDLVNRFTYNDNNLLNSKVTYENKVIFFGYFRDIVFRNRYIYDFLNILERFKNDSCFKEMIIKVISDFFSSNRQNDKTEANRMFYDLLYKESITPNFKTGSYNYTPLLFMNGLKKDADEKMFFKYDETNRYEANFLKLSEYFWTLYNKIPAKQRKDIDKYKGLISWNYLCNYERSPFYKGPVALIFAGGIPGRSRDFYPEKMNCFILSHHLREMGYKAENVLCFYEILSLHIDMSPFDANQIRVFHDKVLIPYDTRKCFRFADVKEFLNNASIFAYSVVKSVMDARGPVLVYYSNHGNEEGFNFPFEPSKFSQSEFEEMCFVLNTFEKHVLFILDCFESSKIAECCSKNRHEFIHFITSSLPNGFSFYTMPFVDICANKSIGRKIHLSSMFFRYFVDAIYSINDCTSLREFVSLINHNDKNVGFEARLFSEDEELKVSLFLKSPTFKYFDYFHQVDNYQPDEIDSSDKQISKCCILKCNIFGLLKTLKVNKRTDDNEVVKDEEYENVVKKEIESKRRREELERLPDKYLTNKQVKIIIDVTIKRFAGDYESLVNLDKVTKFPFGFDPFFVHDIDFWFKQNYRMRLNGSGYSSYILTMLNRCYPKKKDEIIRFLETVSNLYASPLDEKHLTILRLELDRK